MTDLTGKFSALETLLTAQHIAMLSKLDELNAGIGGLTSAIGELRGASETNTLAAIVNAVENIDIAPAEIDFSAIIGRMDTLQSMAGTRNATILDIRNAIGAINQYPENYTVKRLLALIRIALEGDLGIIGPEAPGYPAGVCVGYDTHWPLVNPVSLAGAGLQSRYYGYSIDSTEDAYILIASGSMGGHWFTNVHNTTRQVCIARDLDISTLDYYIAHTSPDGTGPPLTNPAGSPSPIQITSTSYLYNLLPPDTVEGSVIRYHWHYIYSDAGEISPTPAYNTGVWISLGAYG